MYSGFCSLHLTHLLPRSSRWPWCSSQGTRSGSSSVHLGHGLDVSLVRVFDVQGRNLSWSKTLAKSAQEINRGDSRCEATALTDAPSCFAQLSPASAPLGVFTAVTLAQFIPGAVCSL